MNDFNKWFDQLYIEIENLYRRDKNFKKYNLGNNPMDKIFDEYADWIALRTTLSPKVAANKIYKNLIDINYVDFNRKLKRNSPMDNDTIPAFSLIYGTPKEIDQSTKILSQLQQQDPKRYDLIVFALEKVKEVSDKVQPSKNIFGKTTGSSIKTSNSLKMPRLGTLQSFLNMNDDQIKSYVAKFHTTAQPTNKPVAAYKQPYDQNLSKTPVAYKQTLQLRHDR